MPSDTNGDVYISDNLNRRVRRVSAETGMLTTIAGRDGPNQFQGEGGPALSANFGSDLSDLTLDAAGNIYVAGAQAERITRIDRITGIITTVGGSGQRGFAGDGLATAARTNFIASVAVDSAGNIYFSDKNNHRVRKIAADTGIITTVVGNGLTSGALGDNGPATSASLAYPHKVGFDKTGNLLIADTQHFRIRKVNRTTGIITTIIGNGSDSGSQWGNGWPATQIGLNGVNAFAVDPVGNILFVSGSRLLRMDGALNNVHQIPNVPMQSTEGFWIGGPGDLALDAEGRLYIGAYDAVMRVSGIPPAAGDSTPPIITTSMSGNPGTNGWFRGPSATRLEFQSWDDDSFVTSRTGCESRQVTTDTAGITFTCTATSAGGTSTHSVTIRRDSVAPTLSFGTPSPAADASGWNSTDVSVPYVASDTVSGVFSASAGSPVIVTGEGAGLTRQITVTDTAGNSATFTTPASTSIARPRWSRPLSRACWATTTGTPATSSFPGQSPMTVRPSPIESAATRRR